MTFTNYTLKFREHWEKNTKHLEALTCDERSTVCIKDYFAKILCVPKQTISNSYRHRMLMITLVSDLGSKVKQLLLLWEKGDIGQIKRPFNQCDAIVLERCNDLGQSLEQLCQKQVSWKKLRTSPAVSKAKKAVKDQEKNATDKKNQVEKLKQSHQALTEKITTLKRENEEKDEEIRMLRRKLEEAKTTKEVGSKKDENVQEAEEDAYSINLKEGEWIGVMFDSKC